MTPGNSFGNSVYTITFPQKEAFPPYGARYSFHLVEAVEGVDLSNLQVPEYLVHYETFCRLAAEFDLEPLLRQPFHEFYQAQRGPCAANLLDNPASVQLLHSMNCLDDNGSISPDEWEAIGLYVALAFRKVSDDSQK